MTDLSVKTGIAWMRKAYDETFAACVEAGEYAIAAKREATEAALQNLPTLGSKAEISQYIACIAWLHGRKLIEPEESKAHMYIAQLALAALEPSYARKQASK